MLSVGEAGADACVGPCNGPLAAPLGTEVSTEETKCGHVQKALSSVTHSYLKGGLSASDGTKWMVKRSVGVSGLWGAPR